MMFWPFLPLFHRDIRFRNRIVSQTLFLPPFRLLRPILNTLHSAAYKTKVRSLGWTEGERKREREREKFKVY